MSGSVLSTAVAATVALIATSARAGQTARNPVMLMAQNQTMAPARAADGTPPPAA